jgi:hypothetical protein
VSLLTLGFLELRKDVSQLLEAGWPEPTRRRAEELATALWQASSRQGLTGLASISRSLTSLSALSPEKARPLRPQLREKFRELLDRAGVELVRLSGRQTG